MKNLPLLAVLMLLFIGCKKKESHFDEIEGESIDLIETNWVLYKSDEIPMVVLNGASFPIISFGKDGFGVKSSCNHMGAEMVLTSSLFNFKSFHTTYVACHGKPLFIERFFHGLKGTNIFYKYSNGILYLFKDDKLIGSFKRIN